MNRTSLFAASALLCVSAIALTQAQSPSREQQIAQRIIGQTAGVRKGEIVQIDGTLRDIRLLEDLATEVRKKGAYPLVTIDTDRMIKRSFTEVPAELDSQPPKLQLALVDLADVVIFVGDQDSPELLADVPNIAERRAARGKAFEPLMKKQAGSDRRFVELNNTLYPTEWRARQYGMSEQELSRMFWQGVNVDYSGMQTRGQRIADTLKAGKELRITAGGGTDLKVRIAGRPVVVSDGLLSEEDRKRGGPATWAYLPAGEVAVTPVAGTAQGKVFIPRTFSDGKEVRDITLTFKDGKLTSMSGSGPGYAGMKAQYDAIDDARKSEFAVVDFGINDNLKVPDKSLIGTYAAGGTVTVGVGANTWAGGDNSLPYSFFGHLRDATVTLDGKPIVEKGKLKTS